MLLILRALAFINPTERLGFRAAVHLPGALWRNRNSAGWGERRLQLFLARRGGGRSQNAPCINTAAAAASRSPGVWRSGTQPEHSPASRCCGATATMAESAPARVRRAGRAARAPGETAPWSGRGLRSSVAGLVPSAAVGAGGCRPPSRRPSASARSLPGAFCAGLGALALCVFQ